MATGWGTNVLAQEMTLAHPPGTPARASDGGGAAVYEAVPGAPLEIDVHLTNIDDIDLRETSLFLIGLGRAIRVDAPDVGRAKGQRPGSETVGVQFLLPRRLAPGHNPVVLEWVQSAADGDLTLAALNLVVQVDDAAAAQISLGEGGSVGGWFGGTTRVFLENTGDTAISLRLHFDSPDRKALRPTFDLDVIEVEPHQMCHTTLRLRRRARWFGASRSHVFDVTATGSSLSKTATGQFRQRAILPPILFRIVAVLVVLALAVWAAASLVRHFVDDEGPSAWNELDDAPDALIARAGHTITWVDYEAGEPEGVVAETAERAKDALTGEDSDRVTAFVVWGGRDATGRAINSGARYSMTDQSWDTIQPPDAGPARLGHEAVWTGDRLVVFGGFAPVEEDGNVDRGDTGHQLDPKTLGWTDLPEGGPEPRVGHSMLWTGSALIVFGGFDADGAPLADGGILRAGIPKRNGVLTPDAEGDLENGTWSLFRDGDLGLPLFSARAHHAVAWTGRYMIVSGGIGADGELLADNYAYDVGRKEWWQIDDDSFEHRACHEAVFDGERVLILGGVGVADAVADLGPPAMSGCDDVASTTRPDPAAWAFTVVQNPELSGAPDYDIEVLVDAPSRLGADFDASWIGDAVGIVLGVDVLERTATLRYVPGDGVEVLDLPSADQLSPRSQISAGWAGDRVVLWGGTGSDCGDDPTPCPLKTGALFRASG